MDVIDVAETSLRRNYDVVSSLQILRGILTASEFFVLKSPTNFKKHFIEFVKKSESENDLPNRG